MLVICRVELVPLDEVDHVRHFDHDDSFRRERDLDRADELMNVVDVREHVGRGDRLGSTVALNDLGGDHGTPVFGHGWDSSGRRFGGEVPRRVHTDDAHAERAEAREQEAVVARDVQGQIAGRGGRRSYRRRRERRAVVAERLRRRAHVEVIAKHEIAIDDARELRETAADADLKRELGDRLGGREVLVLQIGVREGRRTHVEIPSHVRRATDAAAIMGSGEAIARAVGLHRRNTR